jgi:hypothetical protein
MSTERRPSPGWLALLGLGLVACPGTLEDRVAFEQAALEAGVDAGSSVCGDVPSTLFTPRCGLSSCHDSSGTAAGLDLASPGVFGRLVGKQARGGPGVIIDPEGDPQKSVLYLKLTPTPPFGSQMPLAGDKLDAATLSCVAAWITSEAAVPTRDAMATDSRGE